MKKRISWSLLLSVLYMLLLITNAPAAVPPPLAVSHQWQSTSESVDGLFAVTLSFTLTNTGNNNLSNINLQVHSPILLTAPEQTALTLEQLAAGASHTMPLTLTTMLPVEEHFPHTPMLLHGDMYTTDGEAVSVKLLSEGGNEL